MLQGLGALITIGNNKGLLFFMILLPLLLALLMVLIPPKAKQGRAAVFVTALLANLVGALGIMGVAPVSWVQPWAGFQINLALRAYDFSAFIILCVAIVALLVGVYSTVFLRTKTYSSSFLIFYLITLAMANGAILANNLVVMLFFWEGLLVTLFAMIILGDKKDVAAAMKALILSGTADLLLMLGIAITVWQAGTPEMDIITPLPIEGLNTLGFVCMLLGALGKTGAMPFHSWIPDAAAKAPLPFMAFLPGALEKLLGIYLLVRVSKDFYALTPGTTISTVVMTIGALTIVFAVAMALIQKDMKRLLSYHAISQVGYMVLGVGTALPVGLVGALFHMLNNAIYKSCLFLSAGALEMRVGSTDLREMGGLRRLMPVTTVCFLVAALSIAGVPPFNGFFSKELIFDAAYESGMVFYIAAVLGAFMTAASFLKMGHAAFFGQLRLPKPVETESEIPKEVTAPMYLPMVILAALCVLFGVANFIPIHAFQGFLGEGLMQGHDYAGWPHSTWMVVLSCAVLLLAVGNHIFGFKRTGEAIKAVDHIHYAPGLHQIYNAAEKKYFDPYEWLMLLVKGFSWVAFAVDRIIDWVYSVFFVKLIGFLTVSFSRLNNGHSARYMAWAFAGLAFILIMFVVLV